jgi:hypothetical protein
MTTVNSLTVFLLIGNLQIEITADFWENLGIQYWSIESDYCVQHSLSERAIYSEPSMHLRIDRQYVVMAYSIDEAGERHFLKPISFFKPIK